MNIFLGLYFLFLLPYSPTTSTRLSDKDQAVQLIKQAVILMDSGKYEASLEMLDKAQELDPESSVCKYETAFAYYLMKDYDETIDILEDLVDEGNAGELVYELLGNSYDNIHEPEEAISVYKSGLKLFPNSGRIYLELGILELGRERYDDAIEYWETGVKVQPSLPSNYYWLGKMFSFSDQRIWSVIYGEIFINLEPTTDRTLEMSKILFDTYSKSFFKTSDSSGGVSFCKEHITFSKDTSKVPFSMNFEMAMSMGFALNMIESGNSISIASLNKIRHKFVETWFDDKFPVDKANILFDYYKKLMKNGYFEAYNYGLFATGHPSEFQAWYVNNQLKYDEFKEWFIKNPIEINKSNYFVRTDN